MIAFAALLALSALYQGLYLRHSMERGRRESAIGAGAAILLSLAAAYILLMSRP